MALPKDNKDFNIEPNLGIVEFTVNNIKNEIILGMFKRVVEEGKISPLLMPQLLAPKELACQASRNGEVVIYVK